MARPKKAPTEKDYKIAYEVGYNGLTDVEATELMGLGLSTYYRYKGMFRDQIKKGREDRIAEKVPKVEDALVKRALGYETTEETVERFVDGVGNVTVKTKKVTKQVAPDTGAIIFFLCNAGKANWINPTRVLIENKNNKGAILDAIEVAMSNPIDGGK